MHTSHVHIYTPNQAIGVAKMCLWLFFFKHMDAEIILFLFICRIYIAHYSQFNVL